MKTIVTLTILVLMSGCFEKQDSSEMKSLLMEQMKNSHDNKNWFVPLAFATEGLTAEQANWKDSTGNHSIGELVSHLIFWNERNLIAFHGDVLPDYSGNNKETFKKFSSKNWEQALSKLDSIQSKLNETIESATASQLKDWRSDLANICSHNAYHTGQIIYIRKLKGWWDDEKGVK